MPSPFVTYAVPEPSAPTAPSARQSPVARPTHTRPRGAPEAAPRVPRRDCLESPVGMDEPAPSSSMTSRDGTERQHIALARALRRTRGGGATLSRLPEACTASVCRLALRRPDQRAGNQRRAIDPGLSRGHPSRAPRCLRDCAPAFTFGLPAPQGNTGISRPTRRFCCSVAEPWPPRRSRHGTLLGRSAKRPYGRMVARFVPQGNGDPAAGSTCAPHGCEVAMPHQCNAL